MNWFKHFCRLSLCAFVRVCSAHYQKLALSFSRFVRFRIAARLSTQRSSVLVQDPLESKSS